MRTLLSIFVFLFALVNITFASTTPIISVKIDENNKETIIWKDIDFPITFVNESDESVRIRVWFVDGTRTNDEFKFRACLQDGEGELFGNYFKWSDEIEIPANDSISETYTIHLPYYYQETWKIEWCVIVSSLEPIEDTWNFRIVTRKAFFADINVIAEPDDSIPEVYSYSPQDGYSVFPIDWEIKIKFSESMNKKSVKNAIEFNWAFVLDWNEDYTEVTIRNLWLYKYDTYYTFTLWIWATDIAWNHLKEPLEFTFKTDKSHKYSWWWGNRWWNGWDNYYNKSEIDNCPYGDYSSSKYDGSCGQYYEAEERHNAADNKVSCSIANSKYSNELNQAYLYACENWITTMETIQQADMNWALRRKHLAKMISEFAIKKMWKQVDITKKCEFKDMKNESKEMQYYAQLSCQLGLMWMQSDWVNVLKNFSPNEYVTRAQFWTVISRMLWWTKYAPAKWELFYQNHLQALRNNEIMTEIYNQWPDYKELRWRVMLMLKRIDENILVSNYSNLNLLNQWNINVELWWFENEEVYTNKDYIELKWIIDNAEDISEIHITHMDEKWVAKYNDYKLKKYQAWSKNFAFYAYRWYNSLTVNNVNIYQFDFYNSIWEIISTKIITVNHNYKY